MDVCERDFIIAIMSAISFFFIGFVVFPSIFSYIVILLGVVSSIFAYIEYKNRRRSL